jgi:hypothetical protein
MVHRNMKHGSRSRSMFNAMPPAASPLGDNTVSHSTGRWVGLMSDVDGGGEEEGFCLH